MAERTIKGTIARWGEIKSGFKKDGKTPWAKVSCQVQDDTDWHGFFGENKNQLEEFMALAPIGSEVEFIEFQAAGSEYWNNKLESFNVIKKGEWKEPEKPTDETNGDSQGVPGLDRDKMWREKEMREVRKQALNMTTALASNKIIVVDKMVEHAKEFVDFIYDGFDQPIPAVVEEKEPLPGDNIDDDVIYEDLTDIETESEI